MARHPIPAAFLVLSFSLLLGAAQGWAGERAKITVMATTDMHGNVLPEDPFTRRPDQRGLAKVATLIRQVRRENPKALLLDIGDTTQGAPSQYYHARSNPTPVDPMMLAMNSLGYDSMTVGNHEYNFGLEVLNKARSEAKFPWLSANTISEATGECAYTPYIIKEVDGVRVAVLGITTPGVPYWENPKNFPGLRFESPIETTRRLVAKLRGEQKADIVIAAMHMGLEEDLATGAKSLEFIPEESVCLTVAREVPGIDLILMGHTHRSVPALIVNGVLMAQAGRWGDSLVKAELFVEKSGDRWTVIGKGSTALPVTEAVATDAEVAALFEPYRKETTAWLDKPIGRCAEALEAKESRVKDSAILDLIQAVQLEAGKADVSFTAVFNPRAKIPSGLVTVRDLYSLYSYENTLVVVEATGAQIRAALEHAALFFLPWKEGQDAEQLINPRLPGYYFDQAEGVEYTIDLRRPAGQRITELNYKGAPLAPERKLRVALNNYRHSGGGGYTMYKDCPVLVKGSEELRNLIIQWIERHGEIPTRPDNNWKILY